MASINYAVQYGRAIQTAYPYLSYYSDLWNQGEGQRFRPLRGKTVYIPSMTTGGARAVNRNQITGTFNRNWNNDLLTDPIAPLGLIAMPGCEELGWYIRTVWGVGYRFEEI